MGDEKLSAQAEPGELDVDASDGPTVPARTPLIAPDRPGGGLAADRTAAPGRGRPLSARPGPFDDPSDDEVLALEIGAGADDDVASDDPWAWASRPPDPETTDVSHLRVTAVLVSHQGQRWLPEALSGLADLSTRPARLIAIDNASTDGSAAMLTEACQDGVLDAVYAGRRDFGFGDSVISALEQDHPVRAVSEPRSTAPIDPTEPKDASTTGTAVERIRRADQPAEVEDWLWLLHDDAAPAPDSLAQLLAHLAVDPAIDVTGPKLLWPKRRGRPQQLSEVGLSIAASGRRELDLESGEIDQGQRDDPTPRLAVSSCGMLVRTRIWDELEGFDPAIPGLRDGLEFGWRAALAGHRVVTTPAAEMVHRHVGRAGLRPSGFARRRPDRSDRELGLVLVAAHARAATYPLFWLRLILGSLLRAFAYLLGKAPGRARDELGALTRFVFHPRRVLHVRARLRRLQSTPESRDRVTKLRPPWWSGIRTAFESVGGAIGDRYTAIAGEAEAATLDELTSDDLSSPGEDVKTSPWTSPIVIAVVLAVIACLVAARNLLGQGSLTSPFLLPSPQTLAAAWGAFLDPIPGAPEVGPTPWLGLVALGSSVLAGRPEWLARVLIVTVVPISLLTVYPVVRATIRGRRFRLWVAVSYALLPALLGGTNQGRLTLGVLSLVLPLLVLSVRSLVLRRAGNPEAWRGGWGAGLALTVVVAFQPSMMVLALVLAVIAALTVARRGRKIGRLAIAVAMPLLVWASWWPGLINHWQSLLLGPEAALNGTAPDAPPWEFLLGRPGGSGLPPLWVDIVVFGAIWLVALIGLIRSAARRAVVGGWLVAILSFAAAVALSRLVVIAQPLGVEARPEVGGYLLLGFGALVLAGGIGVDGLTRDLGRQSFSLLQPLAVLLTVVVGAVSLLGAGWWVVAGGAGPITRTASSAIPPYVLNAQQSSTAVRTLAIDLSGSTARYAVIADDQLRLGDADRGFAFGGSDQARSEVSSVVGRLTAGTGDEDITTQLSGLGINYLWITGATAEAQSRIANTPGLAAASGNNLGTVWQLAEPTSRVRIVSGEQTTVLSDRSGQQIGSSALSRTLQLGEAKDSRWRVTLDGVPLVPAVGDDWQQSYQLPANGGLLEFGLVDNRRWYGLAQILILLVAVILAAPGIRRPEVRDPTRSARRVATAGDDQ